MDRGTESCKLKLSGKTDGARKCDYPSCEATAKHRAPKSRDRLVEYFWFCLNHVREYNKSWNFCAGMDAEQIETAIREDMVWRRPTWPIGIAEKDCRWRFIREGKFVDSFSEFGGTQFTSSEEQGAPRPGSNSPEGRAFRILGLDPSVSLDELKTRYKELVKTHHPDKNGGDKIAEERLKDINYAYAILRKSVTA